MKKINILFTIVTYVWISSCTNSKKEVTHADEAIAVKVSKASENDSIQFVSASGKTESVNSANLSTRIMGYVTKVNKKVGEKVSEGQLLLTINNSDLLAKKAQADAAVLQASSAFNNAKKDYDRFVNLFDKQSASQKELDDMTTRYETAKAALEGARQMSNEVSAQFAYTNITAPFSGIITNTFVKEGDMANPGMPLLSMEGVSGMQVTAMVAENDIWAIKNGMPVKVMVKSLNKEFDGKVTEVSLSSKNTGGQYLVKINPENITKDVLYGMFVNVKFPVKNSRPIDTQSERLLIDESALVKHGQLMGIYTIGEGNKAILRWLRTGKRYGDKIEILSGLTAEETYILSYEGKLFNGAKVSY